MSILLNWRGRLENPIERSPSDNATQATNHDQENNQFAAVIFKVKDIGECAFHGVGASVGVSVNVGENVTVGVSVGVSLKVGVSVHVGVLVAVTVGVWLAVAVGVGGSGVAVMMT